MIDLLGNYLSVNLLLVYAIPFVGFIYKAGHSSRAV